MPRPRVHDPDRILDVVESVVLTSGPTAVTIRAVSTATGVSNGALYHAFGSRSALMARAWIRAARRFFALQNTLIDGAMPTGPHAAVAAAADAPVVFAERFPDSSAVMWAVSRDELLQADLPDDVTAELLECQQSLVGLMIRLAVAAWDRKDARAVDTMTTCIVDLPSAIMLRRKRLANPTAREQLRAAVHAVLEVGPPPLKKGK